MNDCVTRTVLAQEWLSTVVRQAYKGYPTGKGTWLRWGYALMHRFFFWSRSSVNYWLICPVFVGFDNVVEFNKNRQNDDDVVKAYKSFFSWNSLKKKPVNWLKIIYLMCFENMCFKVMCFKNMCFKLMCFKIMCFIKTIA